MISLACLNYPHPAIGTRIGRVKVIFQLPDKVAEFGSNQIMPAPEEWAEHGPLAYVEWFAKLLACADPIHMMYEVRKMPLHADGKPPGEVVSLSTIRQSCQLIPRFPRPTSVDSPPTTIPEDWHSHNVLDKASRFLLNNWATKYAYQTLW